MHNSDARIFANQVNAMINGYPVAPLLSADNQFDFDNDVASGNLVSALVVVDGGRINPLGDDYGYDGGWGSVRMNSPVVQMETGEKVFAMAIFSPDQRGKELAEAFVELNQNAEIVGLGVAVPEGMLWDVIPGRRAQREAERDFIGSLDEEPFLNDCVNGEIALEECGM